MTITNKPNRILVIGLPLCIFLACFLITLTSVFKIHPAILSNAILFDLLITAPLIYFIAIRKTTISRLTVIRVFVVGLLVAGLILNAHSNILLSFIKRWVSPLLEAVILFMVGKKFYVADKRARLSGNGSPDFLLYSRKVMQQVAGNEKAGTIIASEIAVFYYTLFGKKDKMVDYKLKFSMYKENGILLVLASFLFIFLVEAAGMHFLIRLWNPVTAWVLTGLSAYTCIQLYAHMKAVKSRPIYLGGDTLEIHNGLAGDALIKYDNIEKFALSKKIPVEGLSVKIALIKGLENHNCVVHLKEPIQVTKIFGIKKTADTVLFFVDRPKDFAIALDLKLTGYIS